MRSESVLTNINIMQRIRSPKNHLNCLLSLDACKDLLLSTLNLEESY
ncbi:Uncharacterised protein [Legionella bozemanae]|nr:Uncharacterised protein [Legionella bozemanae]